MAEHWFRMHANIADKPVVWRLAQATNIPVAKAIGHLAMFWGKVSQQARGGDVSAIPDVQLEAWAGWDGRRGAFVAWLRADHLTDGVVHEYDEYSGRLDERRERDRLRKADIRRKSRGLSAGHPPDNSEDIHTTSSGYDTKRYETIRDTTTSSSAEPIETLSNIVPDSYFPDAMALLDRVPNRDAWLAEITSALDGMHGPAVTAEQLGRAIRDYNANGEAPSLRLFRGYLRDATKVKADTVIDDASQRHRRTTTNPRSDGMILFGKLREAISSVYVQNDPNDPGSGGYQARRIAPEVLATLSPAALTALRTIGGERAITGAHDDQLPILAGQFATAYAGVAQ